jgi:hypothetical protein
LKVEEKTNLVHESSIQEFLEAKLKEKDTDGRIDVKVSPISLPLSSTLKSEEGDEMPFINIEDEPEGVSE